MKKILVYLLISAALLTLVLGLIFSKSSQARFSLVEQQYQAEILNDLMNDPAQLDLKTGILDVLKHCPEQYEQVNTLLNTLREFTFSHYNKEMVQSDSGKQLYDDIIVLLEEKMQREIESLKKSCPQWQEQTSLHESAEKEFTLLMRIEQLESNCGPKQKNLLRRLKKRMERSENMSPEMEKKIERQVSTLESECQTTASGVAQLSPQ